MQYEFDWTRSSENLTKSTNILPTELDAILPVTRMSLDTKFFPESLTRSLPHYTVLQLNALEDCHEKLQLKLQTVRADHLSVIERSVGIFRKEQSAKNFLLTLQKHHQFCAVSLGLESTNQACSAWYKQRCRGTCVNQEAYAFHYYRLLAVLVKYRLPQWPFAKAIVWRQMNGASHKAEYHVFDRWCYFGMSNSRDAARLLYQESRKRIFHLDAYHILQKHLKNNVGKCGRTISLLE